MELVIKAQIQAAIEVVAKPDTQHWNEATDEQRKEYLRESIREALESKMDYYIDDLLENVTITYIAG